MYCEATWVSRGMLPPMRTTEPYSPMARAKASPVPLMIAGAERREDDPSEGHPARGPERRRGLLDLAVGLDEDRLHGADDERQRDEGQGDDEARAGWR